MPEKRLTGLSGNLQRPNERRERRLRATADDVADTTGGRDQLTSQGAVGTQLDSKMREAGRDSFGTHRSPTGQLIDDVHEE
jgi:hypothetical protein